MQSPEEFMLEYLREQTAIVKRQLKDFAPFRRKFYTDACALGRRRAGKLEELLKTREKIMHVSRSEQGAEVVTASVNEAGTSVQLRYRLQATSDGWLIHDVDLECAHCKGVIGDSNCSICNGNGWWLFLSEMQNKPLDSLPESDPPPPPDDSSPFGQVGGWGHI